MAESASESHSTARSALPRCSLIVAILEYWIPVHMNPRRHTHRPQTRPAVFERRHLDPNRSRPARQHPARRPLHRRRWRRRILVREAAERQPVRQYKRPRPDFDRPKTKTLVAFAQAEESGRHRTRVKIFI